MCLNIAWGTIVHWCRPFPQVRLFHQWDPFLHWHNSQRVQGALHEGILHFSATHSCPLDPVCWGDTPSGRGTKHASNERSRCWDQEEEGNILLLAPRSPVLQMACSGARTTSTPCAPGCIQGPASPSASTHASRMVAFSPRHWLRTHWIHA